MKLNEAYITMRTASGDAGGAEYVEAQQTVYKELRGLAEKVVRDGQIRDDVVNDTFLKLRKGAGALEECTDSQVRAYLSRSLTNMERTFYRSSSRRRKHEVPLDDRKYEVQSEVEGWIDVDEVRRRSHILSGVDSLGHAEDGLVEFLRDVVTEHAYSKSPARNRARAYIDEMVKLSNDDVDFDHLVNSRVDSDASKAERKKERQNVWKAHERARGKLEEWLEAYDPESDGNGEHLSEYDVVLLKKTVLSLRTRSKSRE